MTGKLPKCSWAVLGPNINEGSELQAEMIEELSIVIKSGLSSWQLGRSVKGEKYIGSFSFWIP